MDGSSIFENDFDPLELLAVTDQKPIVEVIRTDPKGPASGIPISIRPLQCNGQCTENSDIREGLLVEACTQIDGISGLCTARGTRGYPWSALPSAVRNPRTSNK